MCVKKPHREKASSVGEVHKKRYMSNMERKSNWEWGVGERKKGPSEAVRAAAAVQRC